MIQFSLDRRPQTGLLRAIPVILKPVPRLQSSVKMQCAKRNSTWRYDPGSNLSYVAKRQIHPRTEANDEKMETGIRWATAEFKGSFAWHDIDFVL